MVSTLPARVPSDRRTGAVLQANPAPAELVLALSYTVRLHGVGDKGEASGSLLSVGEAKRALVYMHAVGQQATDRCLGALRIFEGWLFCRRSAVCDSVKLAVLVESTPALAP